MGLIPVLPEQPQAIPVSQNPLTYYISSNTGVTAAGGAWYTIESNDNKIWHIHHIHIRVNDGLNPGTYTAQITDRTTGGSDGTFTFSHHLIGDPKQVDLEFIEPLMFKKRINVWLGIGAGGDAYTISFIGYVQNK